MSGTPLRALSGKLPTDCSPPSLSEMIWYNDERQMVSRRVAQASKAATDENVRPGSYAISRAARLCLVVIGTLFLSLAIAGVLLPLLPTTPFLLLAAACYARSSTKFYRWLMTNRVFGSYIRNYVERRGVPLRVKVLSILLLWTTIGCSAVFAVDALWARVLLGVVAIGVTFHILSLRTLAR